MNRKVFEKVIEELIIPMFPWVVDYEISLFELFDRTFIKIIYYTDKEIKSYKVRKRIMDRTRSLYNMIGGIDNYIYHGVNIEDE